MASNVKVCAWASPLPHQDSKIQRAGTSNRLIQAGMLLVDLKSGGSLISRHARLIAAAALAVVGVSVALSAQRFFGGEGGREPDVHNVPYDGRFTFARAKYITGPGGWYYRGLPAWAHGYPMAEQNLMRIMNELTNFRPHINEDNVFALDDPELRRYP